MNTESWFPCCLSWRCHLHDLSLQCCPWCSFTECGYMLLLCRAVLRVACCVLFVAQQVLVQEMVMMPPAPAAHT